MNPDELKEIKKRNQGPPYFQDIELVMGHTGCTQHKAIDALVETYNDILESIELIRKSQKENV